MSKTAKNVIFRFVPLAILVVGLIVALATGLNEYISLTALVRNYGMLEGFVAEQFLIAILIYASLYIVVVAFSVPGAVILTLAGGLLLGAITGGLVTVVAATIGASIIFLIAKGSLGEALRARAGPFLQKLQKGFQEDAASYLLFLRLVPAFPFWLVNLAPALFGVRFSTYLLTTFFGIMPGTLAYTFAGSGIDTAVAEQARQLASCEAEGARCTANLGFADFVNTELVIGFAILGLVALLPAILKRFVRLPWGEGQKEARKTRGQ